MVGASGGSMVWCALKLRRAVLPLLLCCAGCSAQTPSPSPETEQVGDSLEVASEPEPLPVPVHPGCGERPMPPELTLRWEVPEEATDTELRGTVVNRSSREITATVSVLSTGPGGRFGEQALQSITVGPNSEAPLSVPTSRLPIQSAGAATGTQVMLTWPRPTNTSGEVEVQAQRRALSPTLYLEWQPGGPEKSVTIRTEATQAARERLDRLVGRPRRMLEQRVLTPGGDYRTLSAAELAQEAIETPVDEVLLDSDIEADGDEQ